MFNSNNKTLGKMLILLVGLLANSVTIANNSPVLIEGDILTNASSHLRAIVDSRTNRVWPNGIIPYQLHADLNDPERMRIEEAVAHWNDQTAISLRPVSSVVDASDFVMFIPGDGCASWVGRQGGEQEIWVGEDCSIGSLIHEIGHAVGFEHEHTRPDRDQYISIEWDNIAADKQSNFHIPDHRVVTPGDYDFDSIMHYGATFFSKNGKPTIKATTAGAKNMGQRRALSAGDIAAVEAMYAADLALTKSQHSVDDNTEVSAIVTNNSLRDANGITLTLPSEGRQVLGQSDNDWQCVDEGTNVKCSLDNLTANATSTLSVFFSGSDELKGKFLLTSDTLTANRGEQLQTVSAPQQAYSDDYQASGAGSLAWSLLILIFPLFARRSLSV